MKILLMGAGWGCEAVATGLIGKKNIIVEYSGNDNAISEFPKILKPNYDEYDFVICAGLKSFINKEDLEKSIFINIHYSILPNFRGLHSTVWAILNDEKFLGYTVHLMNEFIDDGPIFYQYRIKNDKVSTSTYYIEHFNSHVSKNIYSVISSISKGEIKLKEQDKTKASWVGKRNVEDCLIKSEFTIEYIRLMFRALVPPYPRPYIIYDGNKIEIKKFKIHKSNIESHYGRILNIDADGIWISFKGGYLVVEELMEIKSIIKFRVGNYINESL